MHAILGEGSYGEVRKENGYAIKSFKKLSHLIQEYVAGVYLRDKPNIIQIHSIDIKKLEMRMTLYQYTLKDYIDARNKDEKLSLSLLYNICTGLTVLHKSHLVHGDLKPNNILIKSHIAYIGDLGFVSVVPYSKVERTAKNYRDINVRHGMSHDIFSLGIIMLELFGNIKLKKQYPYANLLEMSKNNVKNNAILSVLTSIFCEYEQRYNIIQIVEHIYHVNIPVKIDEIKINHNLSQYYHLKTELRVSCEQYNVKRGKRGYKALCAYLDERNIFIPDYSEYIYSLIYILSAVFNTDFNPNKCTNGHIKIINALINDIDFVTILMLP